MAEQITKGNFVKLPREFERFTSRVAAARLGDGAGHLRFGWPTDDDDPERLPTNFRERIDYLRQTGGYADTEWQLKPNTIEELEEIISASNDGHIDVVVWRAFQDQRPGFISWIGQCSCGRTDVLEKEKWSELDYKWLNEILFETSTLVPPRLFYSTPHHIPTDIQLKQMHRFIGLTFDRSRLCLLAESHPEIHREHAEHMTSLIRLVIQNFQAE